MMLHECTNFEHDNRRDPIDRDHSRDIPIYDRAKHDRDQFDCKNTAKSIQDLDCNCR